MPETVALDDIRSLADRVPLNNGTAMPRLGFGTYKAPPGQEVENAVRLALDAGYRGIDTAALYRNEESIGRVLRESGIPREELFVATKVWNEDQGYDSTLRALDASLRRLGLEYVDLYLVHWPKPPLMRDTWRAMEVIAETGRAKAIGVCNHLIHHLETLASFANVMPAVDQVEHHPYLQQPALREHCHANGIVMQAWAPVMRGRSCQDPTLVEIAEAHGKTAAQVSIRWILQHGVTTIPKSVHAERIHENADVFDFTLSAEEMRAIDGLDRHARLGPDPDTFA